MTDHTFDTRAARDHAERENAALERERDQARADAAALRAAGRGVRWMVYAHAITYGSASREMAEYQAFDRVLEDGAQREALDLAAQRAELTRLYAERDNATAERHIAARLQLACAAACEPGGGGLDAVARAVAAYDAAMRGGDAPSEEHADA